MFPYLDKKSLEHVKICSITQENVRHVAHVDLPLPSYDLNPYLLLAHQKVEFCGSEFALVMEWEVVES